MAGAETLAAVALGASGIASVGSIFAGQQQARSAEVQADYDAQVAEQNRRIVLQQSGAAEEMQRRRSRAMLSEQVAGVAESGLGMTGSALDLYNSSVQQAELDAMTVRYDGELRAAGLTQQAEQARTASKSAKSYGRTALLTGILGAGADMAGGAAIYGSRYGGGPSYAPTDRRGYGRGVADG